VSIAFNELANSVLKKDLQDCSLAELRELIDQYPFFGPAQLLLTKKLQEEDPGLLDQQVQTTALYFPNRLWLQHLLEGDGVTRVIPPTSISAEQGQASPMTTERAISESLPELDTEPGVVTASAPGTDTPITESIETPEQPVAYDPVPFHPEEAKAPTPGAAETPVSIPADMTNISTESPSSSATTETKPEPVDGLPAQLVFEPYHTVDYFASQGIKFREEDRPKDRFSEQLKSFTEWLKMMKRIPAAEMAAATDPATEKKVEQMAEFSLAERHITTEAMAEVWAKQGNRLKAEEIYRKLSLLDPSKSSYFAAKIEALKKSN
jgi:hypothetical protein